jgi:hypothetical protein
MYVLVGTVVNEIFTCTSGTGSMAGKNGKTATSATQVYSRFERAAQISPLWNQFAS